MQQYIRDAGTTVEYTIHLPYVVARLPLTPRLPELVAGLRSHPNVDYVEPVVPGTWESATP